MTRRAANRGQEMSHDVRDRLTGLTRQSSSIGPVDEGAAPAEAALKIQANI
jgi:hypothetical protein